MVAGWGQGPPNRSGAGDAGHFVGKGLDDDRAIEADLAQRRRDLCPPYLTCARCAAVIFAGVEMVQTRPGAANGKSALSGSRGRIDDGDCDSV